MFLKKALVFNTANADVNTIKLDIGEIFLSDHAIVASPVVKYLTGDQ